MLGRALAETAAFPAEQSEECHMHLLLSGWSRAVCGWLGRCGACLGRSDADRTAESPLGPTPSQLDCRHGFPARHAPTRHSRFGPMYSPLEHRAGGATADLARTHA